MKSGNIMIVGVGGQGTLLASKMLGRIFLDQGVDVKVSEVHGMSQRGGSVVTYVRYGDKVYSPIIDRGEADLILSFELLEAARWLEYLRPDGTIITNSAGINPMPVVSGATEYPKDLVKKIQDLGVNIDAFDALDLAVKAGSSRAVNIVLLGRLSKRFDLGIDEWLKALEASVPSRFLEMNKKAFLLGRGEEDV